MVVAGDFLLDFENREHSTPASSSCALLEQGFQSESPQPLTILSIMAEMPRFQPTFATFLLSQFLVESILPLT
jgi:hypothetical protein